MGVARDAVKVQVKRYWDWRSSSYLVDQSAELAERWQALLGRLVADVPGKRALDVGTGRGELARYLAQSGWEVTAVDLSPRMLAFARKEARHRGLSIRFQPGDAERLPFADGSFQVVVSRNLLWTLPHPLQALREWRRVLQPGGRLVLSDGWWHNTTWKRLPSLLRKVVRGKGTVSLRFFLSYASLQKRLPLYEGVRADRAARYLQRAGFQEVREVDPAYLGINPYSANNGFFTARAPEFFILTARR